jgi:hypothetical protein
VRQPVFAGTPTRETGLHMDLLQILEISDLVPASLRSGNIEYVINDFVV